MSNYLEYLKCLIYLRVLVRMRHLYSMCYMFFLLYVKNLKNKLKNKVGTGFGRSKCPRSDADSLFVMFSAMTAQKN